MALPVLAGARSTDFPPPGQEKPDGSRDIRNCRYSAAADLLMVQRWYPLNFDDDVPPFAKSKGDFFEALPSGRSEGGVVFPQGDSPEGRAFLRDYEIHPTRRWALTLANPATGATFLTVWSLDTGEALERMAPTEPLYFLQISPDGSRAAFASKRGDRISVFRFNVQ